MIETIGQHLRQARQASGLPLEQVARETHIRLSYLQAMEAGDFDRLPSKAQARGFLRSYASYLNLKPEPLLSALDNGAESLPAEIIQPDKQAAEEIPTGKGEASFLEIGQTLRQRRELLGLSLDDIERHTHLRARYLEALESGDLDRLPSPVQGRGMLHNYAAFLGLDPERLMISFAEGLQARLTARQATRPQPVKIKRTRATSSRMKRLFSTDFLLGGFFVLFFIGFIAWGAVRIYAMRATEQTTPSVPSIAEALQTTGETALPLTPIATAALAGEGITNDATPPAIDVTATPVLTATVGTVATPIPIGSGGLVQISIVARQRAWARVTVDGDIAFIGRMMRGSAYTFTGKELIEILTGNGAALQVFFNQNDLGLLGVYGEVVTRIYSPEGMLAPTPTTTPTPTSTLPATPTPEATETPQGLTPLP